MDRPHDRDGSLAALDEQRFCLLAQQYFEDELDDAGAVELSHLIESFPASRKLFVDMTVQRMALVRILREQRQNSPSDDADTTPSFQSTANTDGAAPIWGDLPPTTADVEWFIREVPLADAPQGPSPLSITGKSQQLERLPPVNGSQLPEGSRFAGPEFGVTPPAAKWGLAAAMLVAVLSIMALALNIPALPAAVLLADAHPQWKDAEQVPLGASVPPDKTLHLEQGAIELKFSAGATVVIRGPAEFYVVDGGRMIMNSGELTAHVPPRAAGFVVESAGLIITDVGTEFALRVGASGQAQVAVLEGRVEVEEPSAGIGASRPIILAAGDSLARETPLESLVSVPVPALETLPRDITQVRAPLALQSTGVGRASGEVDPNWWVLRAPNDPAFIAKPATVVDGVGIVPPMFPNQPAMGPSKWLSHAANPKASVGVYVFEYQFDLDEGIEPGTVMVRARVAADNAVRHVRLNGQDTGLSSSPEFDHSREHSDLVIAHGFVAGRNRIEFDVDNLDEAPMGLRVLLEGNGYLTARRLEIR